MAGDYSVAIRLHLIENATRGLAMISGALRRTDVDAKALNGRLHSIGKMAIAGGALVGAGMVGLDLLKKPLEQAQEYETLVARFRQFGMGDVALAQAKKFVEAADIQGASTNDMMRYFVEAQGVFRESGNLTVGKQLEGAKLASPLLAKIAFASKGLDEHSRGLREVQEKDMLRFVELAGGLNSAAKFNQLADAGFKAIQGSGGNVNWGLYRNFMARAGIAGQGLSGRSLFADFEPLIGELKGSAGVGLMTAFGRATGTTMKMPVAGVNEYLKLGLWDSGAFSRTKQGGVKEYFRNPLKHAELFGSAPVDYYRKYVLPNYQARHLSTMDRARENTLLFGRTGGDLFQRIDRQLPTILRSRLAFNKSQGIDQSVESVEKTYAGKQAILTAKWHSFLLVLGRDGGVLDFATKAVDLMGKAIGRMTVFARAHPLLTKFAVGGLALVSVLAILGGSALLVTAGARLLMLGRLFGLAGGAVRIVVAALPYLLSGLRVIAGVFGLTGALIVGVGLLIWNNWSEIKGSLIKSWTDIKAGFMALFNGDILGALGHFSLVLVRGFQTLFNTIIAGVNTILPTALQIGKTTFADRMEVALAARDAAAQGKPRNVVQPGGGRPMQVHTTVNMDGRKVAQAVSRHQTKTGQTQRGMGGVDFSYGKPPVGMGVMR